MTVFTQTASACSFNVETPQGVVKAVTLPLTVRIFDTDCYGVMWHGAYHKWLELARDELATACGVPLQSPSEGGVVYPVVKQALQYKKPAKLRDSLLIVSQLALKGAGLLFTQTVYKRPAPNAPASQWETVVIAETLCAVCQGAEFKLVRRLPQELLAAFHPILSPLL